jgi:hypothetical protein
MVAQFEFPQEGRAEHSVGDGLDDAFAPKASTPVLPITLLRKGAAAGGAAH